MNVPIGCTPTNCVAEIRMDDHGNPFGELTPFVHFFGEVPKSGTRLYIGTPTAHQTVIRMWDAFNGVIPFPTPDEYRNGRFAAAPQELSDEELQKIYSAAFLAEKLVSVSGDVIAGGIEKAGLRAMRAIIADDRARRNA